MADKFKYDNWKEQLRKRIAQKSPDSASILNNLRIKAKAKIQKL